MLLHNILLESINSVLNESDEDNETFDLGFDETDGFDADWGGLKDKISKIPTFGQLKPKKSLFFRIGDSNLNCCRRTNELYINVYRFYGIDERLVTLDGEDYKLPIILFKPESRKRSHSYWGIRPTGDEIRQNFSFDNLTSYSNHRWGDEHYYFTSVDELKEFVMNQGIYFDRVGFDANINLE